MLIRYWMNKPVITIEKKDSMQQAAALMKENRIRLLSETESALSPAHASLATHRREIREAKRELRRLGCEVEELGPFQVLIPGADGRLENGFAWTAGDSNVRPVEADTAA